MRSSDPVVQALADLVEAVGSHPDAMTSRGELHRPWLLACDVLLKQHERSEATRNIPFEQLALDVMRCLPADWKPYHARDYGNLGPILAEFIDDLQAGRYSRGTSEQEGK